MFSELKNDLIGKTQVEKWSFRAIHIGTFALSQLDPGMRGVGTIAFGLITAAATGATFLEVSSEQAIQVKNEQQAD